MYSNPSIAEVNGKKYKINTSFKVGLKCDEVARDTSISDYERALAILYLLFGEIALKNTNDQEDLLKIAIKYLSCGEELRNNEKEKDMDFKQDWDLILASYMTDYQINLQVKDLHWWTFCAYLKGLTDKCVLNRVREIRNINLAEIKDVKERDKIFKMQKQFELKKEDVKLTSKQIESVEKFYKLTGIKRK